MSATAILRPQAPAPPAPVAPPPARRPVRAAARGVLCGVAAAASGIGLLATSGWLITTASLRPPVLSLTIAIGAVQVFALTRGLARYGERLAVHELALTRLGRLRLELFDLLEPLVPGGLGRTSTGSLLSSFVADTEAVATASARRLLAWVDAGAACLLGAALALLVDPRCAAALAAGGALALAAAAAASTLDGRAARRESAVRAEVAAATLETAGSAVELAAYGRSDLVASRLAELGRRSAAAARRRALAAGLGRAAHLLVCGATVIAVLAVGLADHAAHRLTGVWLAVVVLDALAVLEACAEVPDALVALRSGGAAAARLAALRQLEAPAAEPADPLPAPARPSGVALHEASAVAGGDAMLLEELSCAVSPGRRVALVGASGSGKTTALHLLLGFRRPASGRATLGGTAVGELGRATLAERIAWVPEEPHVFAASVEENLRIGAPFARGEELVGVLRRVGLGRWFAGLPDGLATRLGTAGRPLSAGERQRLVLARALLGDPDVLLVDEPTAHLDPETAGVVMAGLVEAAGGAALLVVTHDPAVRDMVDEVVEVVPGGSHAAR